MEGACVISSSTRSSSSSTLAMRGVAGVRGGLPVQAGFADQVGGALLLGAEISSGALGIGVGQFDQHHLRALQVIAHRHQQDALGRWESADRPRPSAPALAARPG